MKNFLFLVFSTLIMNGCGEPATKEPALDELPEPNVELHQAQDILFDVRAKGETMADMAFYPDEFSVPRSTTMLVRLVNESSMEGMAHNIVFVRLGTGEEVAKEGLKAGLNLDYVPKNENVLANSRLIGPGEVTEFKFITPEVGSYHYICTYPGHFPHAIGKLNVVDVVP